MEFSKRWQNMNPYDMHKSLINEYMLTKKESVSLLKRNASKDVTDMDIIKDNHQFLWNDEDEVPQTWEKKLAKRYYDKLFKEYCIGDLTKYKENKVGLRWRTEKELIDGRGQFSCGNRKCRETNKLRTWEVNFGYVENNVKKNALVKLRLCPDCSIKLNYHHKRKEIKQKHKSFKEKSREQDLNKKTSTKIDNLSGDNSNINETGESSTSEENQINQSKEDIWKQNPNEAENEKSREDKFDEYLNHLFF